MPKVKKTSDHEMFVQFEEIFEDESLCINRLVMEIENYQINM